MRKFISEQLPSIGLLVPLVWQSIFLFIPLAIIVLFSITRSGTLILALEHFTNLFDPIYVRIIGRSLVLAVSTATICLLLSYPVAYMVALYGGRFKNFMLFMITLPFWVNIIVHVYAWYFLLERNGIINTILLKLGIITSPLSLVNNLFAVLAVMVYSYLPFMIMPLYTNLEKLNTRLLEASLDLGASPWQTFTRVTLPLTVPGIKIGFLLVLVPAFGEYAIPVLLGGSKYLVVGSLIAQYFLVAHDVNGGSAFTLLAGAVLLLTVLVAYWIITLLQRARRTYL